MKTLHFVSIGIILLGLFTSCKKEEVTTSVEQEDEYHDYFYCEVIDPELIKMAYREEQDSIYSELIDLSHSVNCEDSSDWKQLPIGQNACDGHTGYIAYHAEIDTSSFKEMVNRYQERISSYYEFWPEDLDTSSCNNIISGDLTCLNGQAVYDYMPVITEEEELR